MTVLRSSRSSPTTAGPTSSSVSVTRSCSTSRPTCASSTSPTTSRRSTCAPVRSHWCARCSTCPKGSCSRSSIPGVGTDRRCIAVEVENAVLVGPDNGLLAPAVAMLGGPHRVVEITADGVPAPRARPDVRRPRRHGARRRAPLRPVCRSARWVPTSTRCCSRPALVPLPSVDDDGRIAGEVLWVDRYGNCQLNLAPEQLEDAGAKVGRRARDHRRRRGRGGVGPAGALGAHVRRRQAVGARRAGRLLRHVHDRSRPSFGGRRARCARVQSGDGLDRGGRRPVDRGVPIGLGRKEARREGRDELGPRRVAGADPRRVDRAVRVPALAEPARRQRVRGPAAVRTLWGGLGGYVA